MRKQHVLVRDVQVWMKPRAGAAGEDGLVEEPTGAVGRDGARHISSQTMSGLPSCSYRGRACRVNGGSAHGLSLNSLSVSSKKDI